MEKGRKQKLKFVEYDILYRRTCYAWIKNNNKAVKWFKRSMNKRYRQLHKVDTEKELNMELQD